MNKRDPNSPVPDTSEFACPPYVLSELPQDFACKSITYGPKIARVAEEGSSPRAATLAAFPIPTH